MYSGQTHSNNMRTPGCTTGTCTSTRSDTTAIKCDSNITCAFGNNSLRWHNSGTKMKT